MEKSSIIFIAFILLVQFSFAQNDPIDTDRPDQTESPVTINKKWIQIEHGFDAEKDNAITLIGSSTLFRYGLIKKIELRLETDIIYTPASKVSPSATELQPMVIGTKIGLFEEKKWLPKISMIADVGIPFLAAASFKRLHAQPGIILAFQNNINDNLSLGYNASAEWNGQDSYAAYLYTFSAGININKHLYSFFEIYGSFKRDELPQHNLDTGLSWLVNNNFKADISTSFGITNAAPDWSIALGFSTRFKL